MKTSIISASAGVRETGSASPYSFARCAIPDALCCRVSVIPVEITDVPAAQLGLKDADLDAYAAREETRHEHMASLRQLYGYRTFSGRGARDLKLWLDGQAEHAVSNEDIARRFVEECRRTLTILPAISTIERLCADALVAAEKRIETRIADRLSDDEIRGPR